ncbi:MAG: hypothetical protein HQ485_06585 [Acidobacteria bacterium]|nr:hypothetical protein [Acidobacteriota bacterium]
MRRLHLEIPPSLEQYYPGGAPADWREHAFRDATESGTKLTMLELSVNDLGLEHRCLAKTSISKSVWTVQGAIPYF